MTASQATDPTLAFLFPGQGSQPVDAEAHDGAQAIRDVLVRQLHLPVRWAACVQALAVRGIVRTAECSPGKSLGGLIKRIDASVEHRPLGTVGGVEAALETWKA